MTLNKSSWRIRSDCSCVRFVTRTLSITENSVTVRRSVKTLPRRAVAKRFSQRSNTTDWEIGCRPSVTSAGLQMHRDCEQRCPELDACINASLWCDGVSHCPSGYDEALTHCSMLLQLPPLHLGIGLLIIINVIVVMCVVAWRICRQRANRSISQHRLKSISSETAIIDGKEVIC